MINNQIIFYPIGIIHSPFNDISNMPIQPLAAEKVMGWIELFPEFIDGLIDLEGFSHITLIYHLHKVDGHQLKVKPFMDDEEHGIFATRSPKRPNAIGLSTVKLITIEKNRLNIEMVDILNGTPLLDIKPFFSRFDNRFNTKSGWLKKLGDVSNDKLISDNRFRNK